MTIDDYLSRTLTLFLDEILPQESDIKEMVLWQWQSGGKRLRSKLILSFAQADKNKTQALIHWAVACELLHNASLVFDDIQDNDSVRRNRPSAWVKFGVASTINMGCAMMYHAPLLINKLNTTTDKKLEITSLMMKDTLTIINGQQKDISLHGSNGLSFREYNDCAKEKTAMLFALSVSGAAIICDLPREDLTLLRNASEYIGLAYQILDDVIDITVDKQHQCLGRDIFEGKRSFMLVHSLANAGEHQKKWLLGILNTPADEIFPDVVDQVIKYYFESGVVDVAIKTTRDYLTCAREEVRRFEYLKNIVAEICAAIENNIPELAHLDTEANQCPNLGGR